MEGAASGTGSSATTEELAELMRQFTQAAQEWTRTYGVMQRELARLRLELARKNEQLKSQERLAALGQMAAGVAHEIRNPLGGIQLYANLLERSLAGRPADLAVVEKILSGVRHMEHVVRQTLTFAGNLGPRLRAVDLAEVVRLSTEEAGLAVAEGPVAVECSIPPALRFAADPDLLRQVFSNLFRNAKEAVGENGRVWVSARAQDGLVLIEVADSGPGVAPELRDRLFDPFVTGKASGVGLGLSVVWRILEAHRGTIRLADRPGGACFQMTLPLDPAEGPR